MTRSRVFTRAFIGAAVAAGFAAPSSAQFNNQWLSYTDATASALPMGSLAVSDINNEVDFAWADLDKDGFTDLVVVRKEPFTSLGRRTNLLLMNEAGVLQDRSQQYASASDVAGDNGFMTATNDRDVVIDDFDGDGWLDFVTATTLSDGLPKAVGHPRIYMNLGNDVNGNWLGMRYEEARIPQLISYSTGNPENPRFCSVDAGDVTGNGRPDLYFGDYDSSGAGGGGQPAGKDLNDRLLINDGTGFFTDESQLRMTSAMLKSAFGNSVAIDDMNGDGFNDVVKDTSLNAPQYVAVSYNDPSNQGFFNIFDDFHFFAPYHTSTGDLNNDGRLDVIISDDGADRFRTNTGNDVFGRVAWSGAQTFSFLSGGDEGFGSNNLVADLDGDGWNDALIADVDVDIGGYTRHLKIYHNLTTVVGQTNLTLREERQKSGGGGWMGAVGLNQSNLQGTHDIAVFDLDNDGDNDLVIGRKDGTQVYTNDSMTTPCGFVKYGMGASAANILDLTGGGSATGGGTATMTTTGVPAASVFQLISAGQASLPFLGGVALIDTTQQLLPMGIGASAGGTNVWNLPVPTGLAGFQAYFQTAAIDASQTGGIAFSNGVEFTICP